MSVRSERHVRRIESREEQHDGDGVGHAMRLPWGMCSCLPPDGRGCVVGRVILTTASISMTRERTRRSRRLCCFAAVYSRAGRDTRTRRVAATLARGGTGGCCSARSTKGESSSIPRRRASASITGISAHAAKCVMDACPGTCVALPLGGESCEPLTHCRWPLVCGSGGVCVRGAEATPARSTSTARPGCSARIATTARVSVLGPTQARESRAGMRVSVRRRSAARRRDLRRAGVARRDVRRVAALRRWPLLRRRVLRRRAVRRDRDAG